MKDHQDQTIRDAGYILSNIAFNLAQKVGHALTSDDVSMLDQARKGWDRAISDAQPQQPSGWRDIASAPPPRDAALDDPTVTVMRRVLVTNNITARNRMGGMSHVWFESPIFDKATGEWLAFDAADRKIHNITHWLDPFADHPAEQQDGDAEGEKDAILRWIIEAAQEAKEPCSQEEPESPAAIRNGKLASIAQAAAQALGMVRGPSFAAMQAMKGEGNHG